MSDNKSTLTAGQRNLLRTYGIVKADKIEVIASAHASFIGKRKAPVTKPVQALRKPITMRRAEQAVERYLSSLEA